MRFALFVFFLAAICAGAGSATQGPPPSPRDAVVDNYFGTRVPDPYRWLESADSPKVKQWVTQQDEYARGVLARLPGRERIRRDFGYVRTNVVWRGFPEIAGPYLAYPYESPGSSIEKLAVRVGDSGAERIVLDLSDAPSGTKLDWHRFSPDAKYLAYGSSVDGTEDSTLHIVRVADGAELPEAIAHARWGILSWLPDNSGFYYGRFARRESNRDVDWSIYFHRLGERPDGFADPIVNRSKMTARGEHLAGVQVSPNGHWLVLSRNHASEDGSDIRIIDRLHPDAPPLFDIQDGDATWSPIFDGDTVYLTTNQSAPNRKIVALDLRSPASGLRTVVAESEDPIDPDHVYLTRGHILINYSHDASSRLALFNRSGRFERDIALPNVGVISQVASSGEHGEFYYGFTSLAMTYRQFRYDTLSNEQREWNPPAQRMAMPEIVIERVRYPSADGTPIPMFIAHKKGIALDGARPTLLTGYGGFGRNSEPWFDNEAFQFIKRGGVFALPNLRGGGEFGDAWHRGGMLENKQNVFDDFIAAARYLIDQRYTSPQHLAITGGSNGGLLVAAAEVQHPELFRAVICSAPNIDMLRYQKFGGGHYAVSEYGSSDDPQQFAYLLKYSPYHNVRKGTRYPATLIALGANDQNVDPMHGRKFAAMLQTSTASPEPILLRVDSAAGHYAYGSNESYADYEVDRLAFLFAELGVDVSE